MACGATIEFGDDFGDNCSTFHCKLNEGHDGMHRETGTMDSQYYSLEWEGDSREIEANLKKELEEKQKNCPHNDVAKFGVDNRIRWCNDCGKDLTEKGIEADDPLS
jgi:hypothetical protein